MSTTKVMGPVAMTGATVATLPVTGSPVALTIIAGIACVVGGLLLMRASRFRGSEI
ncbi:MAG TPA: LPXTG cell wall anchor domain-containing protein [Micromonosporaceae bacterium]|nr:LPXTG cell wall anchor domain-containing protein [Micromonosporaceae bacterium]